MEEGMRVITSTIKKKVKVDFSGLMEENMRVDGETESNMVSELILLQVERPNRVNGKKVKDFIGYQIMKNDFCPFTNVLNMSNGNLKK